MTTPSLQPHCEICGVDEPDLRLLQQCFTCAVTFHLNPRQDVDGIDCGDAWIGATLGVEYYCRRCMDDMQREALDAQGGDNAQLQQAFLVHMVTPDVPSAPGASVPAVPDGSTPSPEPPLDAPPPRRPRQARRRRYRRLDG